jgi:hypothetical protein
MSFVATEPVPAPSTPDSAKVRNDGFFPDIELAHVRATVRLDGTVTDGRLRAALVDAIISVNGELDTWKGLRIASGATTLDDVPSVRIDGESVKTAHYRTAVYRWAKADLTETYRDIDNTKSGHTEADKLEGGVDDHRRAARWAISAILGIRSSTVELI